MSRNHVIPEGSGRRPVGFLRQVARASVCLVCFLPGLVFSQKIAEGGSPLYSFAVHESIEGLKDRGKTQPAAEGRVCPHCGKVHPLAAHGQTNQAAVVAAPGVPAEGQPCPLCGKVHPPVQAASLTNVVAADNGALPGTIGGELSKYYYCTNCKAYHLRKPSLPVLSSPWDRGLMPSPLNDSSSAGKAVSPR